MLCTEDRNSLDPGAVWASPCLSPSRLHPQQQWVAPTDSDPHPELKEKLNSDPVPFDRQRTSKFHSLVMPTLPHTQHHGNKTCYQVRHPFLPCGQDGAWKCGEKPKAGRKLQFLGDLGSVVLSLVCAQRLLSYHRRSLDLEVRILPLHFLAVRSWVLQT